MPTNTEQVFVCLNKKIKQFWSSTLLVYYKEKNINLVNSTITMKNNTDLTPTTVFWREYCGSVLAAVFIILQANLATTLSHGNNRKTAVLSYAVCLFQYKVNLPFNRLKRGDLDEWDILNIPNSIIVVVFAPFSILIFFFFLYWGVNESNECQLLNGSSAPRLVINLPLFID